MSATRISNTPDEQVPITMEAESVLVVNDLPEQRLMMQGLLRKAGYNVLTAEGGGEAFQLAKEHHPGLIISDVCMPKGDGLELCRLIRADNELRTVPILLVSALLNDTASVIEGLQAGADEYLEVPFDSARLVAKVARMLERSRVESSYHDLVEQATDLIFTQDLSGRITSINIAGASFVGLPPRDIIGQPFSSIFGVVDLDGNNNNFSTYFSDPDARRELRHQFVAENGHGDKRWLNLTISALRDRANHIVGFRGLASDITDQKLAELALRDSEERYRQLFESTPQPIWVYEEETLRFLAVNQAAIRKYGYTREEFLGMTIDAIREAADDSMNDNSPLASQNPTPALHRTKDDRTIHVETAYRPLVFDGKNCRLVTVSDVSERILLEQARQKMNVSLQLSETEWRQTFDSIDFPVLIVDFDGEIERSNHSAQVVAGIQGDITGLRISDLGDRQPWKKAARLIEGVDRKNFPISEELIDESTGKTWSIALFLLRKIATIGDRAILIAQDITKKAELEAAVRQSQMMSMLGSLVAGVAHEVRNPLFAISSNLDALEQRFSERTEYKRYTDVLRFEIGRLNVLMEDLLEYGKPSASSLESTALHEVISRSIRSCLASANAARVKLINYVPPDLPRIMVDRRRLNTVFINLIENAIQHSPSRGLVTIEARRASGDLEWLECVVNDAGPGIRDEDLVRIFEPFFSNRRGGTGLGLAIAQRIVEENGGKLIATNNPEGGASMITRFRITTEVSDG